MVRGKMVVFASVMHEAYHELKISAVREENDVLVVIQTAPWMVDKPSLA